MNFENRAAALYAINLSAEIEVELAKDSRGGPVLVLLALARAEAAEAIEMLADADPENPAEIRKQQNRIVCFRLICEWLNKIVADGYEADDELDEDDREDLADSVGLGPDEADDALRFGFSPETY